MGQIVRLGDIIARLSEFDDDDTIYVREPWTAESDAMVATEPEVDEPDGVVLPPAAAEAGLSYFLEIYIARELVEDWIKYLGADPGAKEMCEKVIFYATYDAYEA
jgi:hypothetical protein